MPGGARFPALRVPGRGLPRRCPARILPVKCVKTLDFLREICYTEKVFSGMESDCQATSAGQAEDGPHDIKSLLGGADFACFAKKRKGEF